MPPANLDAALHSRGATRIRKLEPPIGFNDVKAKSSNSNVLGIRQHPGRPHAPPAEVLPTAFSPKLCVTVHGVE